MILRLSFLFVIMASLLSCNKQDEETETPAEVGTLEAMGLLGTWEIQGYAINGISDLSAQCCHFLEFAEDNSIKDYKGIYKSYGEGYENNGSFELQIDSGTISFANESKTWTYLYDLQGISLNFEYTESGNTIQETWGKTD